MVVGLAVGFVGLVDGFGFGAVVLGGGGGGGGAGVGFSGVSGAGGKICAGIGSTGTFVSADLMSAAQIFVGRSPP